MGIELRQKKQLQVSALQVDNRRHVIFIVSFVFRPITMRNLLFVPVLLLIGGCASTPNDPTRLFSEAKFLSNEAVLYVGKPFVSQQCSSISNSASKIVLQGKPSGDVPCETYAEFRLKPGTYGLEVEGSLSWPDEQRRQELVVEAGKRYFVEIYWRTGASSRALTFFGGIPVTTSVAGGSSNYIITVRNKGEPAPDVFTSLYRVQEPAGLK